MPPRPIALELVDAVRSTGVIPVPDPGQVLRAARNIDIFVRHPVVTRTNVSPDNAGVPIREAGIRALQQPITRPLQLVAEAIVFHRQLHVGVAEQQVVVFEL